MSLIFSNLVVIKTLSSNHRMYNLYAKFVKILEICKQFSENLVNDSGNVPRRGPVPKFSDLEVVALSLTAETESIDSEKWLFDYKLQEYNTYFPSQSTVFSLYRGVVHAVVGVTIKFTCNTTSFRTSFHLASI